MKGRLPESVASYNTYFDIPITVTTTLVFSLGVHVMNIALPQRRSSRLSQSMLTSNKALLLLRYTVFSILIFLVSLPFAKAQCNLLYGFADLNSLPAGGVRQCTDFAQSISPPTGSSLGISFSGGAPLLYTPGNTAYHTVDMQNRCGSGNGFSSSIVITFSQPVNNATLRVISGISFGAVSYTVTGGGNSVVTPAGGGDVGLIGSIGQVTITPNTLFNGIQWDYYVLGVSGAVTTPAAEGTLQANPSSASPGTSVRVTGSGWTVRSNDEYQLLFDGNLVARTFIFSCSQQPDLSFDIPCGTAINNNHTITITQGNLSKSISNFRVTAPSNRLAALANCSQGGINSLTLNDVNSPLTDNNILINGTGTLQKIGKKIFPDKDLPNDRDNKRLIKVTAQTTGFPTGTPIYFKAFDPDDRSTDDPLVDCNASQGDDNRGQDEQFYSDSKGTMPANSVPTISGGLAVIYFAVTTFAGDNFSIAASASQQDLNVVAVDVLPGSPSFGIGLRDGNGIGSTIPNGSVAVSEMITVWRRLHIELDTMGRVKDNPRASPSVPENNARGSVTTIGANTDPLYPNTTVINAIFTNSGVGASLEPRRFELGVIRITGIPNVATSIQVITNDTNSIVVARNTQLEAFQINPLQLPTFVIIDDDDFNGNNSSLIALRGDSLEQITDLPDTFNLMKSVEDPAQNVFAPAFIIPMFDGAGKNANNDNNIQFFLNIPSGTNLAFSAINAKRDSATIESDDYWVAYVLIGYQSGEFSEFDPNDGEVVGGVTPRITACSFCISDIIPIACTSQPPAPKGSDGSVIFVETMRDHDANVDRNQVPNPDFRTRTAPHEVGHQMGLAGDKVNFGIMTATEMPKFVPSHVNILRWRVKSPGQ